MLKSKSKIAATRLCSLRNEKNISQEKFAEEISKIQNRKSSYSVMTISNWETGRKIPPTETIIAIAQYYNVTIDFLLGLSDDPSENASNPKEINISEFKRYHNIPVYIVRDDSSEWGIILSDELILLASKETEVVNTKWQYYIEKSLYKHHNAHVTYSLNDVLKAEYVYCKSKSTNPNIRKRTNGWYKKRKHTFEGITVDETLNFEDFSITYEITKLGREIRVN